LIDEADELVVKCILYWESKDRNLKLELEDACGSDLGDSTGK